MESNIVNNLKPEFEPVAIVWSNTIHEDTFQFKKNKSGCILYLFAEASRSGKISAGSHDGIKCIGGRSALGFGYDFTESAEILDRYIALNSKGIRSTAYKDAYQAALDSMNKRIRAYFELGERLYCNAELAREYLLYEKPRFDIPYEFVLFKPLSRTLPEDNLQAVIFPLNPNELGALITIAGSTMKSTDPVQVPQGPDCGNITSFAYVQNDLPEPRAILGMFGIEGRNVMRKRFREDILTLTLPVALYYRVEEEINDCILQLPSWRKLFNDGL